MTPTMTIHTRGITAIRNLMQATTPDAVSKAGEEARQLADVLAREYRVSHPVAVELRETASLACYYGTTQSGLQLSDEQLDAFAALNEHCRDLGIPLPAIA